MVDICPMVVTVCKGLNNIHNIYLIYQIADTQ